MYVDARLTLAAFEGKLQMLLKSALDSYLAAHREFRFKPGGRKTNTYSYGSHGDPSPYTSAWREGMLGNVPCTLALGVWWRPAQLNDGSEFVLFACFNDTGGVPKDCEPKRAPQRGGVVQVGHRYVVAYRTAQEAVDLAADAQFLLEEFASAFAA